MQRNVNHRYAEADSSNEVTTWMQSCGRADAFFRASPTLSLPPPPLSANLLHPLPHFPTPSPRAHAHACTQDSRERAALEQQLREAREAAEAREVEWENWLDEKLAEERSRLQTEFEGERARTRDEVRLSGLGLRA